MALQARRTPPLRCLRFETARTASTQTNPHINAYRPPPYPYGPSTYFRRADSGLFGASAIQFGNKVSHKNEIKSRRVWRPNIHNKRLWSNFLQKFVQVKVQARVLRTIDKLGGLDEYLVGSDSPARIKELGVAGWGLRWRVMQTGAYKARVKAERSKLGLPEQGWMVEEKERLKAERTMARAAADAYLDTLEGDPETAPASIEEEVESATGDIVAHLEAGAAETAQVHEDAEVDLEGKSRVHERQDYEMASEIDESISTAENHRQTTAAAHAHLAAIAASINSTPEALIKHARDTRRLQAQQAELAAEQKAEQAAQQTELLEEIDSALATHHSADRVPDSVRLYGRQLAKLRQEVAEARQRRGKKPFTAAQMEMHVRGPPRGIPMEKWQALALAAKGWQRDHVRRKEEGADQGGSVEAGSTQEVEQEAKTKSSTEDLERKRLAGKATWWERFKLMLGRGWIA